MRKSELFRQFRAVCQEVHDRNQLRWKIEAMSLMNWKEVLEVIHHHDFTPVKGWFTTGLTELVQQCADHRATAKDFKTCFAQIWKTRLDILSRGAEVREAA
jgi:hypothetical protein